MPISIHAEDRVTTVQGDETIYLPGPTADADQEGPFDFEYPRLGKLIRMQRKLRGLNPADAAAEEIDGMLQWLAHGLGREAWTHLAGRLEDDDDVLDEEHMVKLFQLLNEGTTGRPTTSSSGASARQPWRNTSTAAPSPSGSVSGT